MRLINLLLLLFCFIHISYSNTTPFQKEFIKIENGFKYIIKITQFEDGHQEKFITTVPVKAIKDFNPFYQNGYPTKDILWDENAGLEGMQISFEGSYAIENAFNNALEKTEQNLGLAKGTYGRINLQAEFREYDAEIQTFILINEVKTAFLKHKAEIYSAPLESVDYYLSGKATNDAQRLLFNNYSEFSQGKKPYFLENDDIENLSHNYNNAMILSDALDEIAIPHIRTIYEWIFADSASNWYHRELLLHENYQSIQDDYNIIGAEGLVGIGVVKGKIHDASHLEIHGEQNASVLCVNLVDPKADAKFCFKPIYTFEEEGSAKFPAVAVDE